MLYNIYLLCVACLLPIGLYLYKYNAFNSIRLNNILIVISTLLCLTMIAVVDIYGNSFLDFNHWIEYLFLLFLLHLLLGRYYDYVDLYIIVIIYFVFFAFFITNYLLFILLIPSFLHENFLFSTIVVNFCIVLIFTTYILIYLLI